MENLRKIKYAAALVAFLATNAFATNYDSLVATIINTAGHRAENIGFVVRRISDGRELAALNADKKFIPASLQKLFTAAAALDRLGINHRVRTRVYVDGFDRETGEVKGDMYILGAGDAGITAERLWLMAQHLYHAGVKKIPNRLVIDNSLFSPENPAPGYGEVNSSRAYMAPISAFAVSFNSTSVVVQPNVNGQNAFVYIFPPREDVQTVGTVSTAQRGQDLAVSTRRHPTSGMEVLLSGTVRPDAKPKYVYRQVWEPVINAAESFRAVAKQSGIEADFTVDMGVVDTTKAQLIMAYDSEPLAQTMMSIFKFSNNFTSEMMLLTLTAHLTREPATWAAASQVIQNWWRQNFPRSGEISVANGSGMGSRNQSSAAQFADLLGWVVNKDWFFEYITTMAVAGVDGTLSTRFRNTDLRGNFRAKTGTLNDLGVSSLAGYFRVNGELYSAVFIANDRSTTQFSKWVLSEQLLVGVKREIEKSQRGGR